jgi:hypothetical protein
VTVVLGTSAAPPTLCTECEAYVRAKVFARYATFGTERPLLAYCKHNDVSVEVEVDNGEITRWVVEGPMMNHDKGH